MNGLLQDFRYAVRVLAAKKTFTIVSVLTLAVAIGANTTVFSLVDAMIFKPLPVRNSENLVAVYNVDPNTQLGAEDSISYLDYIDYRDKNDVFSGLVAYGILDTAVLGSGDQVELVTGDFVSGNYFDVLGVKARLGTTFHAEDDSPTAGPVAVLNYSTWQRRFEGDPNVVGRKINFFNIPFTIVGVTEEQFTGLIKGISPEFWIPLRQQEILYGGDRNHLKDRRSNELLVMGRLKDGVTLDQAKAQMANLAHAIGELYPDGSAERRLTLVPAKDIILFPAADRAVLGSGIVLMALAGFVLLIACANLANLLISRSSARRREIAVRIAVGGSRWRLVRQLLIESIVLAMMGGTAGLLVASWCTGLLNVVEIPLPIRVALGARLDWRVLAFTVGLSVLTGIVFGLLPALQASRPDIVTALKDDSSVMRSVRRAWMRSSLVVAQVTVSLVLLIFAGLAVRSLKNTAAANPGFNPESVGVAIVDASLRGYDEQRTRLFSRDLLNRVRRLPSVQSATLSGNLPLSFNIHFWGYSLEGPEDLREDRWQFVDGTLVSDDYFRTMQIRMVEGREFSERDETATTQLVVVNETFARQMWPGRSALGQPIYVNFLEHRLTPATVSGVAADGKYRTLGEQPRPFIYGNLLQNFYGGTLVIRAQRDLASVFRDIRATVREMDARMPVFGMQNITERMSIVLLLPRYAAMLFGAFGLLGALLALVGLYGVVAYSVGQRTREIGIRMALGGRRSDVLKLIISEGMKLTFVGLGLGLIAASLTGRFISSILYGVGSTDAPTFLAVSGMMTAVALAACYIPAYRASRVDPMIALRHE